MTSETSDRAASAVPDELVGPTPREVYLSGNLASFLTVVVLLFIVGGGTVLGWWTFDAIRQSEHRAALRSGGQVIGGSITALTYSHGDSFVSYTFTVNGRRYFGKSQVSGATPLRARQIAVVYLPSDPAINHPAAWEWSPLMQIMVVPFSLFFMGVTVWGLAHIHRERVLARKGKPARGIVTSCTPEKSGYQIEYEFRTDEGEHVNGTSDSQAPYESGQNIWILYLTKDPRRNHSYPLSDYEIPG
jgi:hypothetical protein